MSGHLNYFHPFKSVLHFMLSLLLLMSWTEVNNNRQNREYILVVLVLIEITFASNIRRTCVDIL